MPEAVAVCSACGKTYPLVQGKRLLTCGQECHGEIVGRMVAVLGEFRQVVDAETGLAHRVPTKDVLENGLRHADLAKYPLWEEQPLA